jgi:hypothetical protein
LQKAFFQNELPSWAPNHSAINKSLENTEDPKFESRQGVRFLGFETLQCCFQKLICIVISFEKNK